ncbi:uncharacterized protein LOC115886890 [Sitophilus oryzae]|uniref:Uncharacterized protein LOC115886890 n=1 Tax=Sitophilus oryzae TaxID=7048 RepID=A0A6J2YGQ9_SITOR|nr:uncharacterized protein LOC115886890 [Sitophilus oryzae]
MIDGKNLTNLRFADDIVLLSDNLRDTEVMLRELAGGVQILLWVTVRWSLCDRYNYLGHEIQITRDNQTYELKPDAQGNALSWAAYGKLQDVFKGDQPIVA